MVSLIRHTYNLGQTQQIKLYGLLEELCVC